MVFEAYSGSKYQLPIQVTGEIMHPSNSEFLIQDGLYSHTAVLSHPDFSFGNLSRTAAAAQLSPQLISNDMDPGILASNPYLAASMEKNTLFKDFHSHMDGCYMNSSNCYMDSYQNLPSSRPSVLSPMSLSTPRAKHSFGVDHLLVPDQGRAQQSKRQQNQLSVLSPTSQSILQANQVAVPSVMKFDGSGQVQKKPRLDITKDDVIRYMIQQILLSESSKELQGHDLKLVASPRQYQFPNAPQKETIQFPSKSIEAPCQQPVAQLPMICRQIQLPERQVSPVPVTSGGIYADRLMQYIHHQRQRPKQNSIAYWRKFVAEFFDSNAKKRWCLSKYDHVGHHAHFAFSRGFVDSWRCDLCGTKSGRGFEAKFEVLPRLCKVIFDNGVVDELLYLDFPCESKLPMGCVMLQYTKAVQETVYKNSRVVHEGQLRVTFTKELKIISWEFCAESHEEFVLRRSIAPQVKQLIQVSQKYQDNIDKNKSGGNLSHAMQATHNRFVKAGQQLEKTLDSHVNELGLSKQLARFLQVAEVIDCMKDLITYSQENNLSPIESLNQYAATSKFKANQMNERALHEDAQDFFSIGNKPMRMSSIPTQNVGNGSVLINGGGEEAWNSSAETNYNQRLVMGTTNPNTDFAPETSSGVQEWSPWNSYQNLLTRNSITSSESMMMVSPGSPNLTQTQGDQDPRRYVLNKLLMQKMFNCGGAPQEPQLPMSSQIVQARGIKGRNTTTSNAAPRRGPKCSSSGQSRKRVCIKKEIDEVEDFGLPMLPGVQVKKEVFYG